LPKSEEKASHLKEHLFQKKSDVNMPRVLEYFWSSNKKYDFSGPLPESSCPCFTKKLRLSLSLPSSKNFAKFFGEDKKD
jgi:hypothetical protein